MKYSLLIFLVLIGFNIFIWHAVLVRGQDVLNMYFLDVGQGDSELIILPGGVKILIDGGPNKGVLYELAQIVPETDRYIDLIVMTHAQLDHFEGLSDVVDRYKVGAFITSGREGASEAWRNFESKLKEEKIPVILVEAGDRIRYKDSYADVLSPDRESLVDPEINESSVVLEFNSEGVKSLFTGDMGFVTENKLVDKFDVNIDVLKVGHHGSRYATGLNFLREATPRVSVIEVGAKNTFGHPTQATLSRLAAIGSSIYRTDQNGLVTITAKDGLIGVSAEK